MLQSLHVHNFALIEDAKIDFAPGFNIFTGETGAGKSILIDAFGVVLGNRASVDYIRSGADSFWVQAVFDISRLTTVKALLAEQGIDEEDELFLRRRILANGKSQATVNGVQVPLAVLKSFSEALVDIHGQHENQALLKADAPLSLVDLYGRDDIAPVRRAYQELYNAYLATQAKLTQLENTGSERERILDRLDWEIKEITDAALEAGELETLQEEAKRLQNSGKIMAAVSGAHDLLDTDRGILENLAAAKDQLTAVLRYDERLGGACESLESSWITLDECRRELSDYLSGEEYDGQRAATVESRLDLWYRLQKKYGDSYEAITAYLQQAQQQADELTQLEANIAKTKQLLAQQKNELEQQAQQLTKLRCKYAAELASKVTEHIHDLAMPEGKFEISVTAKEAFGKTGKDELTFLFTANLGETIRPLLKVASGGELSRVALAIKTVLLNASGVPTMVFDEIDTGVGGVTAQKMAEKIAVIATVGQVLCITHLPQIASFADRHILIHKESADGRTSTGLATLDAEGRIRELMRMTVGDNVSEVAYANAKELLAAAVKYKQAR
ncbi:DNA repair protein RecN [uncultured Phascolarctobacterium sp.]|uniref:DNA repair protein RecN n=1 Tax=uncultured Phascolarctobacterium sp. TaxID=512296 RepID=UPI0015AF6381|nr:DNA repair protein RecN [uncultured Phascolarctobacterium sp.]